jgi:hypothetical protein
MDRKARAGRPGFFVAIPLAFPVRVVSLCRVLGIMRHRHVQSLGSTHVLRARYRLAHPGFGDDLRKTPVEPDRPGVDRVDPEMSLAPGIAREGGAHSLLRLGLDREYDARFVGERAAENHETLVEEPIHERRVRRPVGLLLERPRRIPLRAGAAEHDEEHVRILVAAEGLRGTPVAVMGTQTSCGRTDTNGIVVEPARPTCLRYLMSLMALLTVMWVMRRPDRACVRVGVNVGAARLLFGEDEERIGSRKVEVLG